VSGRFYFQRQIVAAGRGGGFPLARRGIFRQHAGMKALAPLIPLFIFPIALGLILWGAVVQRRRTAASLQKLAGLLGLPFEPATGWFGQPAVSGALRGRAVRVFNYTTGSGKSRVTWSAVTAQTTLTVLFTFTLKKRSLGTRLAELFGAHEVAVGDPEFDRAWFVQTSRPELMRAMLLPELRAKLMEVRRAGATGAFEHKDGAVKYAEVGSFALAGRAGRFPALAGVVCDLADVAEVAAEGMDRA
jgi:hypothetical protein